MSRFGLSEFGGGVTFRGSVEPFLHHLCLPGAQEGLWEGAVLPTEDQGADTPQIPPLSHLSSRSASVRRVGKAYRAGVTPKPAGHFRLC